MGRVLPAHGVGVFKQNGRGRKRCVGSASIFVSGKKDVFATMICPRRASPRRAEGSLRNLEWLRPRRARWLTITFASDAGIARHRRFKRRACCADHGPAYYSRLNRLQARDCLLSVISPLLVFTFCQQAQHQGDVIQEVMSSDATFTSSEFTLPRSFRQSLTIGSRSDFVFALGSAPVSKTLAS